jgi:hypothetical protein
VENDYFEDLHSILNKWLGERTIAIFSIDRTL